MRKFYIHFGDIPADGRSKIWHNGETIIGEENGVRVYDCCEENGKWRIILPFAFPKEIDYPYWLKVEDFVGEKYSGGLWEKPVYLVTGEEIGKGVQYQPVIDNVEVIKQLFKEDFTIDNSSWWNWDEYHKNELGYVEVARQTNNYKGDMGYWPDELDDKPEKFDNYYCINEPTTGWSMCTKKVYDEWIGEKGIGKVNSFRAGKGKIVQDAKEIKHIAEVTM